MFYLVYQTTNLVNNKIYVGCHQTINIDDGYLGSGRLLLRALHKYGRESFHKKVLAIFDNPLEMFQLEASIVNEDFVKNPLTYNVKIGGEGGWSFINRQKLGVPNFTKENAKVLSIKACAALKLKSEMNPEWYAACLAKRSMALKGKPSGFKGKAHSESTKRLMSERARGNRNGAKNSQFGTCWMFDPTANQAVKIKVQDINEYLLKGFIRGRTSKLFQ